MVALRQVLDRTWLLGLMTAEERDRAQRINQFEGSTLPAGGHLPIERVGALMAACDADLAPPDVDDPIKRDGLRRVRCGTRR
ncbi:hypothetical protein B0I32_15013 [Nonomuraea fuscirosea]|uniref:Uncharacterized protein n=1 Tax=Nonomuraea fuscirosea TaxID=1291556 RepID=A0A2T0LNP6_9ACTN|nr:hypothetical protein B0I32_15013 [Nonomuraea fuscirosea]